MGLSELVVKEGVSKLVLLGKGLVNWSDRSLWYPKLLFEDKRHNILLTDNSSLWLVDDQLRKIIDFTPGKQASDNIQRSYLLADDDLGHLYAFSSGGVVYKINSATWKSERIERLVFSGGVSWAGSFHQGEVWVVEGNRLRQFETREDGELSNERILISGLDISWIIKVDETTYLASTWTMGLFQLKMINGNLTYHKIEEYGFKNANQIVCSKKGYV